MPIFQDDIDRRRVSLTVQSPPTQHGTSPSPPSSNRIPYPHNRRLSEESLPLELCEGPLPDSPVNSSVLENADVLTSDRSVLIERLKRGESPTWIPTKHFNSALQIDDTPNNQPLRRQSQSPSLLNAAQLKPETDEKSEIIDERFLDGVSIERPRSALHSGDFTHDSVHEQPHTSPSAHVRPEDRISAESAWFATSPPRNFTPSFHYDRRIPLSESFQSITSPLSSSLSSSFAYQPPTSPLAQSISNDDLDPAPLSSERFTNYRRQTFGQSPLSPLVASPKSMFSVRREPSFAYQAHQPRRSLTGTPNFLAHGMSPGTPSIMRSRRLSFGSDASPRQHTSMVGSYEESILRGRMSSTPSKPLEFMAQIGVLGKGNCKPSLKCPPHVTLSFPAVYYNYSNTSLARSQTSDNPSPYVGQIDLENGLPNSEHETGNRSKVHTRYTHKRDLEGDVDMIFDGLGGLEQGMSRRLSQRKSKKQPSGLKAPVGGSYRIPEQGQLQIIIKNQNKTAVKLFLIPYDLSGMEPGTKTFIRQRSYSSGPVIDDERVTKADPLNRPMLRYLVHLNICCPSKGRFYLYKSIRIVFANRVPEGKEKLRNETTWPEPRFTPYKAAWTVNSISAAPSASGAQLTAEKAFRRRSLGLPIHDVSRAMYAPLDTMDSINRRSEVASPPRHSARGNTKLIDTIPFEFPPRSGNTGTPSITVRSPSSNESSRPSTEDSSYPFSGTGVYKKLSKDDIRYGGQGFATGDNSTVGNAAGSVGSEGLLSQRLRSLGMNGAVSNEDDPFV